MRAQQNETHCKARTKAGKACQAAAMEGGLCFFHAHPNKAAELGRIGGRKNRHYSPSLADPPRDLNTAKAVKEECARLIENVYTGKVSPKVAACLGTLLSLQMRVIHDADVEARLTKLEQAHHDNGESATEEGPRTLDAADREAIAADDGSR